MTDLEQRLRDYGRDADAVVQPLSIDDLRSHASAPDADRPAAPSRVWRGPGLVTIAACVVLAVGLGFVLGRLSAPESEEQNPPADSTVVDPFVTLPEPAPTLPPDPIDEVMETSIGSIAWTRVEGDSTSIPERVAAREGSTLIGEGSDPTVWWTSTDGGLSWERTVNDGVRREAGGHEWVWRPSDAAHDLARVTPDGDVPIEIGPAIGAPPGWNAYTFVAFGGLPVELDGTAFVLSSAGVSPDLSEVATALGTGYAEVTHGDTTMTFGTSADDSAPPANTATAKLTVAPRAGSALVDLIDRTGEVVTTIDTRIDGFAHLDPIDIVFGARISQWSAFDGDVFVPLDVPWPSTHSAIGAVRVGDAVLVSTTPAVGPPGHTSSTMWRTTDGRTWEGIAVPVDDLDQEEYFATLVESGDGAILEVFGRDHRRFLTDDGRAFEELSRVPATGDRRQGEIGWVALDHSSAPTLWVSGDGDEWERVAITSLYNGRFSANASPRGSLHLDGSTIYIVVITGRDHESRTLLIGDVTPPS